MLILNWIHRRRFLVFSLIFRIYLLLLRRSMINQYRLTLYSEIDRDKVNEKSLSITCKAITNLNSKWQLITEKQFVMFLYLNIFLNLLCTIYEYSFVWFFKPNQTFMAIKLTFFTHFYQNFFFNMSNMFVNTFG